MLANNKINVLYLDDEIGNLNAFKANFRRDFNIYTAISVEDAFEIIRKKNIHVAISDHKMPEVTGVDFFEKLVITHPDIIRILLTGYTDVKTVIDAINRGQVYRYFSKPMNPEEIRSTIYGAHELFLSKVSKAENIEKLRDTNEQLEFMLRQKLIS